MNWAQAGELFDQLVPLSPGVRETRLLTAALDSETRDVIRRMLKQADRETRFMQVAAMTDATPILNVSDKIGVWRIETLLGRGGMGEVYRVVRDDGQYKQTAALKLLHTDSHYSQDRFARERQILAKLEHPNLSRLIDGGVSEEGQPFLVMEYVTGEDVIAYARTQALSLSSRLELIAPMASALAHAHSRLVLHRDIKPSNVLVTPEGQIKLIDFGVASVLSEASDDVLAPLSKAYAAPEQWRGESVSVATDVFGLGALTHELLTGQVIDRADIEAGLGRLPTDVASILRKSLSEKPSERYQSVQAFSNDIENFIKSRPVEARNGGKAYRLSKFFRRYRAASLATMGLILALSGGVIATSLMAQKAEEEAQRATRAKDAIVDIFRRADPFEQDTRLASDATAWEYLALASDDVRDTLKDDPQSLQEVLSWSHVIERRAGQFDRSLETLKTSRDLTRRLFGDEHAQTLLAEVQVLDFLADFRTSESIEEADLLKQVEKITNLLDDAPPTEQVGFIPTYNLIADIFKRAGLYEEAVTHYKKTIGLLKNSSSSTHDEMIKAKYNLAECLKFLGQFEAATQSAQESLSLAEIHYGENDLKIVPPLSRLANIYDEKLEAEKAIPLLERAIAIERQYYDGLEGSLGLLLNNLANSYTTANRLEEAEEIYLFQIKTLSTTGEEKTDTLATLYQNIAQLYEKQGRYDEAAEALTKAGNIRETILGPTDLMRYISYISLSRVNLKQGDWARARENAVYAAKGARPILPDTHFIFGMLDCFEGEALAGQSQTAKARLKLVSGSQLLKDVPSREAEFKQCQAVLGAL